MAWCDVPLELVPQFLALLPNSVPVTGTLKSETEGLCRFELDGRSLELGDDARVCVLITEDAGVRTVRVEPVSSI